MFLLREKKKKKLSKAVLGSCFLSHQQTTVEEKSRIMQLEEELSLRRAEITNLQVQLKGADASWQKVDRADAAQGSDAQPETLLLREQLVSAGREHYKESSELREKYETALAASQQEIDSLKAVVEKQNVEINEMKQKAQQATKENVEMMDTWKVRCSVFYNCLQVSQSSVVMSVQLCVCRNPSFRAGFSFAYKISKDLQKEKRVNQGGYNKNKNVTSKCNLRSLSVSSPSSLISSSVHSTQFKHGSLT